KLRSMFSGAGSCLVHSAVAMRPKMSLLSCLALRGDGMKKTWFHHTDCSTEQADELVKRYKARGVRVERGLNPDFVTWTVSAYLPTSNTPARPDSRWKNRMWG